MGRGRFFSFALPKSDANGKLLDKISSMLAKQGELSSKIGALQNKMVKASVIAEINDFFKANNAGTIQTYYNALRNVDSSGSLTADEKAARRKTILVHDVAGDVALGSICKFDELTYSLGSLLTMNYSTMMDDKPYADLFTLYDEWQKLTFPWEHQGYAYRADFQSNALSQYTAATMVDKLSLVARMQELPESERETLSARLDLLNEQIDKVQAMSVRMTVKMRADNVRYYQIPGHEKLLSAYVSRAVIPQEDDGVGLLNAWNIKGLVKHGGSFDAVNTDFWNTYTDKLTVEYAWLKNVYADYRQNKTLYEIFFDPNEGNLISLNNNPLDTEYGLIPDENCLYAARATGDCALKYDFGLGKTNHVEAAAVNAQCALERHELLIYNNLSTTRYDAKKIIKINELPSSTPDTRTDYAPSTPSDKPAIFEFLVSLESAANDVLDPGEGFAIADCDANDFAGVKLNGKPLQKDNDYFIDASPDGGVTLRLDDDIYDSLDEGTHFLHVYFTNGHGSLQFKKAAKAAARVDVPATGDGSRLCFALCAWVLASAAIAFCGKREGRRYKSPQ